MLKVVFAAKTSASTKLSSKINIGLRLFATEQAKPAANDTNAKQVPNATKNEEAIKVKSEEKKVETKIENKEPPVKELDEKERTKLVKAQIRNTSPSGMKFFVFAGAIASTGAIFYYWNERDHYERKVDGIIKLIDSEDPDRRKEGLLALPLALTSEIRLPTTVVEIPHGMDYLLKRGVVDSLLKALQDDTTDIASKEIAVRWLQAFSAFPEARKIIIRQIDTIIKHISPDASLLTFQCSTLFYQLSQNKESAQDLPSESISTAINRLNATDHPLSVLLVASISDALSQNRNGNPPENTHILTPLAKIALNSAIASTQNKKGKEGIDFEHIGREAAYVGAFSALGAFYGNIRWWVKARVKGLSGATLSKFVKKQNRVGRWVFYLLVMDAITEAFLKLPEKGVSIPIIDEKFSIPQKIDIPLVGELSKFTYVPMTEAALFTLFSLVSIRFQRFVVAPMALAGLYAHQNTFIDLVKPYTIYANNQQKH